MIDENSDQTNSVLDDQDLNQIIHKLRQIKEPIIARKCTDLFCLFILVIIFLIYFGIGAYYLIIGQSTLNYNLRTIKTYVQQPLQVSKQIFIKHFPYLVSCIVFSLILGFIYLIAVIKCTKHYFYLIAISSAIVLIGTLVISIVDKSWVLLGFSCFCLVLQVIFLVYFYLKKQIFTSKRKQSQYINIGRNFTDQSTNSILKNKRIFIFAFLGLLCIVLFTIFWIITLLIIQIRLTLLSDQGQQVKMQVFSLCYWCFILLYAYVFFYYYMTFLIAINYSFWYFKQAWNVDKSEWKIFFKGHYYILRYHLGSLAFAAFTAILIKVPVTLSNFFLWNRYRKLARCCLFYMCCIKDIQNIAKFLSKYSIIAMSVCGVSFVTCARILKRIVYGDYENRERQVKTKFFLLDSFSDMFQYGAIITNSGLPTLVCYLIVTIINKDNRQPEYYMTILYILTYLICTYFSLFFISTVTVCNSCLLFQSYLFNYCVEVEEKKKKLSNEENEKIRSFQRSKSSLSFQSCPQIVYNCYILISSEERKKNHVHVLFLANQILNMNFPQPQTQRNKLQAQKQ